MHWMPCPEVGFGRCIWWVGGVPYKWPLPSKSLERWSNCRTVDQSYTKTTLKISTRSLKASLINCINKDNNNLKLSIWCFKSKCRFYFNTFIRIFLKDIKYCDTCTIERNVLHLTLMCKGRYPYQGLEISMQEKVVATRWLI